MDPYSNNTAFKESSKGAPLSSNELHSSTDLENTKDLALRSARFRKGREESWRKLEGLLTRLEKKGLKSLTAEEDVELPRLYQVTLSSLAVARHIILDRHLLMYLENLSFRAYVAVYGPRQSFWQLISSFFKKDFPQAVRSIKWHIFAAFIILVAGFISGFLVVQMDSNNFHTIVPQDLAPISPTDTPENILEREIFPPWPGFEDTFISFANFLFRHNTMVALLSFSTSFLFGIPTIYLTFGNGQVLGAVVSLHEAKGLAIPYIAWLSIHGITEILAILLASGAGLSIAHRMLLPGHMNRLKALSSYGKQAALVMLGTFFMLFIAAIFEGGFRQLIGTTIGRFVMAAMTAIFWYYYFIYQGRDHGGK
ncbi:MAG: stage II sporulation protein M [Deltaproteobacteria bacterium]|jgi:uncharacterized membrane protein SpoIIM required for sporulation|nr:stage II sporulation protein M [Deltaproteobacteria bacterium]